ncbi:hypothetical protein [Chishuiella sp.]|uniref:hypothetical protein n=1 Tax=Chishuiella sp. TaxID=1969467 RepID=UPI0028B24658|nr:hypothetical protein [Chishuiella sp.]
MLLGHSDGGSIALIVAGKYPNQIKGAIIEAGHIFVEEITLRGIYDAKKAYETIVLKNIMGIKQKLFLKLGQKLGLVKILKIGI